MKSVLWTLAALAFWTMTISARSCSTVEERLSRAATVQGKVEAGVKMPEQPEDCRRQEAHAEVKAGTEARSALIRERGALDRQNARTWRCADFYDDVKSRLGAR